MFRDRIQAGELLAEKLKSQALTEPYILAVPRGGVIVAAPLARALSARIEVLVSRKIGHPLNPEVAIGAVMPDGSAIIDREVIDRIGIPESKLTGMIDQEYREIRRRLKDFTGGGELPPVAGKQAVIVDDGIATGYTIRAAVTWLKKQKPAKVIIAVPVAPPDIVEQLAGEVDQVVCLEQPFDFLAVGMHYRNFAQTSDEEVRRTLREINQ